MQKIYAHPDIGMVHLVRNELENRGIETMIQGEHLTGLIGGGSGIEAWVELWVVDDARIQEAMGIVRGVIEHDEVEGAAPWKCPNCGEEVEPQFAVCWNCGQARPGGKAS